MSCRQRPEYRRLTSSLTRQVEEFEVATSGGSWVAIGGIEFTQCGWRAAGMHKSQSGPLSGANF